MSTHYSPLTIHASLPWMGDPEDDDEEEEKKKPQQEEDDEDDEDNEGEEQEVPWQVKALGPMADGGWRMANGGWVSPKASQIRRPR